MSTPNPIDAAQLLGPGTRAAVIYNPVSGTHNVSALLPAVVNVLRGYGWQVDVLATERAGDMQRLAAQARAARQQVVLVAGGDGSINEAANALVGGETILGVLPSGTANVWAREINLPVPAPLYANQLADAARANANGQVRVIDVGRARERCFVLWSGVGLDAHVTATIEPRPPWVKRFGAVGYTWRAFWIAMRYRGTTMKIELDGLKLRCRTLMVLISNAQLYGGIARPTPQARLDDGWLDVTIFKGGSFREMLKHGWLLLLRRTPVDPDLIVRRARHIRVTAKRPCYAHVDAEPIGFTPIEITIVPQALRVLVPRTAPQHLFVS